MSFFLQAFLHSLYDMKWLSAHRKEAGKAWGYFFLFIFLMSLIFGIPAVVNLNRFSRDAKHALETTVPDFQAKIVNGELEVTGVPQPYIWTPDDEKESFAFILDTVTSSTLESRLSELAASYQSFILVTKQEVAVHNGEQSKTQIQRWNQIKEAPVVTKAMIMAAVEKWFGPLRALLFFFILFFIFVAFAVGKLLYLLFVSALLRLAAAIGKKSFTFTEIYTIGLFAITLPTIVRQLLLLANVTFPFYSLILLILMIGAMWQKGETPPAASAPPPAA